jgi:hypothetical protein
MSNRSTAMRERDFVWMPSLRGPSGKGGRHPGIVVQADADGLRAIVVFGTSTEFPGQPRVAVGPKDHEVDYQRLALTGTTYFYAKNTRAVLDSAVQHTGVRCTLFLFLDLQALAETSLIKPSARSAPPAKPDDATKD